jgi:hypothetical protein
MQHCNEFAEAHMPTSTNLDAIGVIIGGLLHGGEQGNFDQPLLAGLHLTGETNHHESDFRLESLGDSLAHAHFGHNPFLAVFGDDIQGDSVFAGLFTNQGDSALIVTAAEQPILLGVFGAEPHLNILDLFDTSQVL